MQSKPKSNPGVDAAKRAAAAINDATVAIPPPESLPPGGSDFNDMHQHAGLEAVKTSIQSAIDSSKRVERPISEAASSGEDLSPRSPPTADATSSPKISRNGPSPGASPLPATNSEGTPFSMDEGGLWFIETDNQGRRSPLWVCSPFEVTAQTRDGHGDSWGYLIEFVDPDKSKREVILPRNLFAGDGNEYRSRLLSGGLDISTSTKAKHALTRYIQSVRPVQRARTVDRCGWHKPNYYVLARQTLGKGDERLILQSETAFEPTHQQRGDLADWQTQIGAKCVGNARLAFAVSFAFAAPLLRWVDEQSGGVHFVGESSTGKTTLLRVATSVFGAPDFMRRWRATGNGLEALAVQRCDSLLCLDELAQIDAREAGEAVYMLANESGKVRAGRTGTTRYTLTWKTFILSSGEIGLAQHVNESGKTAKAGQSIRLIDLPADAGKGMGIFEDLHGIDGGAALSESLQKATGRLYGTPGRKFIEHIIDNLEGLSRALNQRIAALVVDWVPREASGQVSRVARRFAVIAVAGELATEVRILPWPSGEATRAAKQMFDAWIAARGGVGSSESYEMLKQVKAFLELHGDGRFAFWHRSTATDDRAPRVTNLAGYKRAINAPTKMGTDGLEATEGIEGVDYFVHVNVFRDEVCKGYNYKAVCTLLVKHGLLEPSKGHFTRRERVPSAGQIDLYKLSHKIMSFDIEAMGNLE